MVDARPVTILSRFSCEGNTFRLMNNPSPDLETEMIRYLTVQPGEFSCHLFREITVACVSGDLCAVAKPSHGRREMLSHYKVRHLIRYPQI